MVDLSRASGRDSALCGGGASASGRGYPPRCFVEFGCGAAVQPHSRPFVCVARLVLCLPVLSILFGEQLVDVHFHFVGLGKDRARFALSFAGFVLL